MIAALFVQTNGCYFGLPGVDPWDEARDARKYVGKYSAICHPPCQRFGRMWFGQPLAISKGEPRKILGDDGGCFKHSLETVRRVGGVIEHPKDSHAWKIFGINHPPVTGGWIKADKFGSYTCCVEQGRYGHYARKPTWLYVCHIESKDLPELNWGISEARYDPKVIARMGLKRAKRLGEVGARGGGKDSTARIATPIPFRDLLISIARSVTPSESRQP